MFPVRDYSEYRPLIKGYKYNNNSFLPNQVKEYVSGGRLFCSVYASSLFLFFDEKDYCQLVVYMQEAALPPIDELKKMLGDLESCNDFVSSVIVQSEVDIKENIIYKLLSALDLKIGYINDEYHLDGPFINDVSAFDELIGSADMKQFLQIEELWRQNLPCYVLPFFNDSDRMKLVDNHCIMTIGNMLGNLQGALYYDSFFRKTTVHHIVVTPEARGGGIGRKLVSAWLADMSDKANEAVCWIERNNIASQRMFESLGFEKTGKVSYQFIKGE